jgi:membrane protease subunit HflC
MLFDFNKFTGGQKPQPDTVPDGEATEAMKLLWKGITRRLMVLGILVLVGLLLSQIIVITMPNEYVVIKQFGEVKSITTQPGVSFKLPFVQTVSWVPKDIRHYDMAISDVITQDKKTMVADSFVLWRVSDPIKFIRQASGSISQAESFIGNNSYNSLKNVISRLPQTDIISGRDTLAEQIFDNLGGALDDYGLEMVAIETKHLDLPDDNKEAVYARMISERNNIAAQYQAEGEEEYRMIKNETDKKVNILVSNANAQASASIWRFWPKPTTIRIRRSFTPFIGRWKLPRPL